jgi:hypothetical protein
VLVPAQGIAEHLKHRPEIALALCELLEGKQPRLWVCLRKVAAMFAGSVLAGRRWGWCEWPFQSPDIALTFTRRGAARATSSASASRIGIIRHQPLPTS